MLSRKTIGSFLIANDPEQPELQFASLEMAVASPLAQLPVPLKPDPVPWPAGKVPTPQPLLPPPDEKDDLTKFQGYDAVVVTWTSAEANTLATLFTPGHPVSTWYEYRYNNIDYIPLVTGNAAPFNDTDPRSKRYYQSMGLYFPCTIGTTKVLLFKSGLHFVYDGPGFPVKKLMREIYDVVRPKVFITTGTGGAIGKDVLLGDVVIAPKIKFDCYTQYKDRPFHDQEFATSGLPAGMLTNMPNDILKVNGARVDGGNAVPKMWADTDSCIVTTDTFAYDNAQNTDHLQGLGRACDMGDAMVAMALNGIPGLQFYAIRNASDPQMSVPDKDQPDITKTSFGIYNYWGGVTTAASVIATWCIITTTFP
jgi:hypothetical protein